MIKARPFLQAQHHHRHEFKESQVAYLLTLASGAEGHHSWRLSSPALRGRTQEYSRIAADPFLAPDQLLLFGTGFGQSGRREKPGGPRLSLGQLGLM